MRRSAHSSAHRAEHTSSERSGKGTRQTAQLCNRVRQRVASRFMRLTTCCQLNMRNYRTPDSAAAFSCVAPAFVIMATASATQSSFWSFTSPDTMAFTPE